MKFVVLAEASVVSSASLCSVHVGTWAKMWFGHGAVSFGGFIYVTVQNYF